MLAALVPYGDLIAVFRETAVIACGRSFDEALTKQLLDDLAVSRWLRVCSLLQTAILTIYNLIVVYNTI